MTIMCSYNRVDGVYASESKDVLVKLLRKKLKYKGVVISDWGAVQDKIIQLIMDYKLCLSLDII